MSPSWGRFNFTATRHEATPEETTVEQTTEFTVEAITEENVAPEVASMEDELARCEVELYATKGPNAIQRWEACIRA